VLTIHNIGYQGVFPRSAARRRSARRPARARCTRRPARRRVSFLKTGVLYADALTTVSPHLRARDPDAEYGMGLEELLRTRARTSSASSTASTTTSGIRATTRDPAPLLTPSDRAARRASSARCCSASACRFDPRAPVFGVVSRLTAQKGFELLPTPAPVLLQRATCACRARQRRGALREQYFQLAARHLPEEGRFYRGFHEALAHWIEAGSDMFLMPSRYEPCGLNQMYSLRYGTCRSCAAPAGSPTRSSVGPHTGSGTGFLFDEFSSPALLGTHRLRARELARPSAWRRLVQNGMAQDFSWARQGHEYVELYPSAPEARFAKPSSLPHSIAMHVLFVEPAFPQPARVRARAALVGARVSAIGESPLEALGERTAHWLSTTSRCDRS
jgi:starch synthase